MQATNYQAVEPLHEGPISLVCRARRVLDDEPVILKCIKAAASSPEVRARVRREYEVARSLNPGPDPERCVRGVVATHALEVRPDAWVIVQEDFGGESLSRHRLGERLSLIDKLHVAIEATRTLGQLHRRRIVHNDLNPHHIVYNPHTREVKLIDFGISFMMGPQASAASHARGEPSLTTLSDVVPSMRPVTAPEGTLPYCAPEQTGRTSRGADYRADYYSLGVTLYELLTGRLPFESTDPLELVHAHLARQPAPPHDVNPALPTALSRIVLKLMAKNAEDRYQSAWGIESDLRAVRDRVLAGDVTLDGFVAGEHDVPARFQIPRKLYGRAREIGQLTAALDRVVRGGAPELWLLSGYSGVGKSSLIHDLGGPVASVKGAFVAGKFEQFQRNIPYSAISRAFADAVSAILAGSERDAYREAILAALGPNARLVTELVPELTQLIGPQPEVPPLGPSETENRFKLTLLAFLSAFCRPDRPLLFFLDDLQWADLASLSLLETLLGAGIQNLLVIGAYRDNEVDATHPLALAVTRLERSITVGRMVLAPLAREHVVELLSETLREPAEAVADLAGLIFDRTRGNPFFITQFLSTLHEDGLVTLSDRQRWTWDVDRIRARDITDNVVELLLGKLKKLPAETQGALRLAACVGNRFDLETLAVVRAASAGDTALALLPAVEDGFVAPTAAPGAAPSSPDDLHASRHYRFAHDRVQQAAHALIDPVERRRVHHRIGALLLDALGPAEIGERLFEIVDHLNEGADAITSPAERMQVARLGLDAAARAREATAYQAAKTYAERALAILPEGAAELRFALRRELAQADELSGAHEAAEAGLLALLEEAQGALQIVEIESLLIRLYTLTGRWDQAIVAGRRALHLLGIELPDRDLEAAFEREAAAIQAELARTQVASLLDRPAATSREQLAAMRVLVSLNAAGMYTSRPLYNLIVALKVRLSLAHGHIPESAFAWVSYGVPLASTGKDLRLAHALGLMARELGKRHGRPDLRCKIDFVLGTYILPWKEPFAALDSVYDEGYRAGIEGGDLLFAGNILAFRLLVPFWSGRRLGELIEEAPRYLAFEQRTNNRIATDRVLACYLILLNLTGGTAGPLDFTPTREEDRARVPGEAALLASFTEHGNRIAAAIYLTMKGQIQYVHGEPGAALATLAEAEPLLPFVAGTMTVVEHVLYTGLAAAAIEPGPRSEALSAAVDRMRRWADHGPENFHHRYLLLAAEEARLAGRAWEAMSLYDRAIAGAMAHEQTHLEALACERAAAFWMGQRKDDFARGYLQRALLGYKAWGAARKVEQIEARHGELLASGSLLVAAGVVSARSTPTTVKFDEALDLATVLKASQAIGEELILDALARKLVNIVLENAGAERGCLLLPDAAGFRVAAAAAVSGEGTFVPAQSIVDHVARKHEDVVLRDAAQEGPFIRDPVIRERKARSVLATPLLKQGRLLGILYLENNLVAGTFNAGRLEMLHMLSAQIAVSIENAQLYAELEDRVAARTRELSAKNEEVSEALRRLRQTQEQLVQREKLASLGALTAGIAHELRNPLNFINNFASLTVELVEELGGAIGDLAVDDPEVAEVLGSIRDNVTKINHHGQRADRIIHGMLLHSRQRSGAHGPTDLNKVVAEAVNLAHHSFRAQKPGLNMEIVTDCDPRLSPIEADAADLQRVMLNLIDNALYAALTRQKTEGPSHVAKVRVSTRDREGEVEIRVRDNGPGISAANAAKLFTPFFTTKPAGEGVGLGLSICHDVIARGHRGSIRVESEEGQFAEFVITLPRR